MFQSTLLLLHIFCATIGLLSGFLSMALRKGSGPHRIAGNIFFVSMLLMSSSAAYMAAFLKPIMINVIAGLLTFYLVATGWWAGKRRDGGTNLFDRIALLFALAVGTAGVTFGIEALRSPSGAKDGMPAPLYFIFGGVQLLCATSDVRMLIRGSVVGAQRLSRHLSRMCTALLIATLSFYPGQAKLFPQWIRATNVLFLPHVLLIGSMIYWAFRVRARKRKGRVQGVSQEVGEAARPHVADHAA